MSTPTPTSAPRPESLDLIEKAWFVRDYRDLDTFKKWLDGILEHRHLNETMGACVLAVGREPR